jgi:hypothetical protein
MSCFQLPVATCEQMRKCITNQRWGWKDGKRKMHEWLSSPKSLGGMGLRDMNLQPKAMLGCQCWRLLTDPTSLCARVLKGRYYPHCDFWETPCLRSASYAWRSILHGRVLVQAGARWGVGNGSFIRIAHDNWIPGTRPNMLQTLTPLTDGQTVVSLLADGYRHGTNCLFVLFLKWM